MLAIISLTVLYFGFSYLKGNDFLSRVNTYYGIYNNIDKLTVSNPVIINGLSVGRVSDIRLLQQRSNQVLVEIHVDSEIKIPLNSKAVLISEGFLGGKAIELFLNNATTSVYQDGDTLHAEVAPGISEFLKESAEPMADDIGVTIGRVNLILENLANNSGRINATMQNLVEVSGTLRTELPAISAEVKATLGNLSQNSQQLSATLAQVQPILAKMNQVADSLTVLELNQTLQKAQLTFDNLNANLATISAGEGTMGKLIHDDSLYFYLKQTTRDLDQLLLDLQENPNRYVHFSLFGRKD